MTSLSLTCWGIFVLGCCPSLPWGLGAQLFERPATTM